MAYRDFFETSATIENSLFPLGHLRLRQGIEEAPDVLPSGSTSEEGRERDRELPGNMIHLLDLLVILVQGPFKPSQYRLIGERVALT